MPVNRDRPPLLLALLALLVALLHAPAPARAEALALQEGRITYKISHPFKAAEGWLEKKYIQANLDFDAASPQASRFSVVLDATGFQSGNELRDAHTQEQIGADRFKTVKFLVGSMVVQSRSEDASGQKLKLLAYGKMQFHGVLRDVSWPIDVTITPTEVVVDSRFTLDIRDYGMEPKSIVGIAVSPEVPVHVHLVFKR